MNGYWKLTVKLIALVNRLRFDKLADDKFIIGGFRVEFHKRYIQLGTAPLLKTLAQLLRGIK